MTMSAKRLACLSQSIRGKIFKGPRTRDGRGRDETYRSIGKLVDWGTEIKCNRCGKTVSLRHYFILSIKMKSVFKKGYKLLKNTKVFEKDKNTFKHYYDYLNKVK
jgi:hypothetical protein